MYCDVVLTVPSFVFMSYCNSLNTRIADDYGQQFTCRPRRNNSNYKI